VGYVSEKRGVDLRTETFNIFIISYVDVAIQLSHPAAAYWRYLPLCGMKFCQFKEEFFYD
jgi:hypothetical protein